MAIATEIEYASLDDLLLDPKNPRVGRRNVERMMGQSEVLDVMRSWALEELALSFIENAFWPQEAVIVVMDPDVDLNKLVVAEGNRRIAALKLLKRSIEGDPPSKRWAEFAESTMAPTLFERIPYIRADSRDDIQTFLGFRHVTGIKEWAPAEKAEYIARLVDSGMTYTEVMRAIGSKTPAVRQHYISYYLLRQIEDLEDVEADFVENRFSILFLSIRELGVQTFLGIDPTAEPPAARTPVPEDRRAHLASFVVWVFGTDERQPLFTDSRLMTRFAKVLLNEDAVEYLMTARHPTLDAAAARAGTDADELLERLQQSIDGLEQALSIVHLYTDRGDVITSVERLGRGVNVLVRLFPSLGPIVAETNGRDSAQPSD